MRWQIATGINDAGGKFATFVNDTGGKQWDQLSDCGPLKMNLKKKIYLYCTDPIDLIFYRERASQPAKNETKEK